jgi:PucR C-terminal helix-turn-helix domain
LGHSQFEQQLQVMAEQLADALERSVIIDDAALRPVAVSAQTGLVDASRIEAVLTGSPPYALALVRYLVDAPASEPGNLLYEATIRAYLDCGANVQQAAALLRIHRTTLYWRLARVTDLLAADLSRGDDRLKLHLALKLAELTRPSARHLEPGAGDVTPLCYPRHRPISATARSLIAAILAHAG